MKSCHVMVKSTGAQCNLRCDYCFYLDKVQLYPQRQTRHMDDATLELLIRQQIEAQETEEVIFAWQGGEPTLAGLDFFQRAVALQRQYAKGKTILNTFQTNGMLLNDAWCAFFHRHQFLIGLSVDGDAELHDCFRKTTSGKPTHHQVEDSLRLLQQHDVAFNTLTVLNAVNSQHPLRIYEYLKKMGSRHMQFIPLLEPLSPEAVSDRSVRPEALAVFLKTIFYHWVHHDIGIVEIPLFEHAFAAWMGLPPLTCIFAPRCGSAFALEMNGDLYQCDHFVEPAFKLGNIHETSISHLRDSKANRHFAERKQPLAAECQPCPVRFACHGGCPKDRISLSSDGQTDLNYFCAAYRQFFSFVEPYMLMMKSLYEQGLPPADIRHYLS